MKDVEERVLQMTFENDQFEQGINTSIKSLDKLNKSLDMTGAEDGLERVGNAANKISFGGLLDGLEQVKQKFSFIEVLGYNAFNRISNSILNAASSFARFISGIDGAREGLSKYGSIMTSTNTLQIATGESLDKIKETIEDLNWFSDETSYTLDQMIGTMSKFSSAGVGLEEARDAVKGIALWAAESGANAQTTNRVMYQLSQAYGRGYIMAQDWMSVEQANMATQKIQNQLIEEGGKKAQQAIKAQGGFRDSLRDQWLTTEILDKVLAKYSDGVTEANFVNGELNDTVSEFSKKAFEAAQNARSLQDVINAVNDSISTGWYNTFQLIFGDKDQSAKFFTDMATDLQELADHFASARNTALEAWNTFGGRDQSISGLEGIYNSLDTGILQIGSTIKNALFPKRTREEMLDDLQGLSDKGDELIRKIKTFNRDQFKFQRGYDSYKEADEYLEDLYDQLDQLDDAAPLLKISKGFDNLGKTLDDVSTKFKKVQDAKKKVEDYKLGVEDGTVTPGKLEVAEEQYDRILSEVTGGDNGVLVSILLNLNTVMSGLGKVVSTTTRIFTSFARAFSPWLQPISKAIESVTEFAGSLLGINVQFDETTKKGDTFYQVFKRISDATLPIFTQLVDKATTALQWLAEKIETVRNAIGNSKVLQDFNGYLEDMKAAAKDNPISKFINQFKTSDKGQAIKDFFTNVGTGIKNYFSQVKEKNQGKKSIFQTIQEAFTGTDNGEGFKSFIKNAAGLFGIFQGLRLVKKAAEAFDSISTFFDKLSNPLNSIREMFYGRQEESSMFEKIAESLRRIAPSILMIASSIALIAGSVVAMGNMSIDDLVQGLIGMAVVVSAIVAIEKFLQTKGAFKSRSKDIGTVSQGPNQLVKGISGLLIIAFAIRNMARTVKALGTMDTGDMIQGLIGMAASIAMIMGVAELLGNYKDNDKNKLSNLQISGKKLIAGAAGFAIIANSLIAVAAAVRIVGTMDIATMWSSLGVLATMTIGILEVLSSISQTTGKKKDLNASSATSKRMIAAGFAFAEIANSLLIVSAALRIVGTMDIATMWNSMLSLGSLSIILLLVMDYIGQAGESEGQQKSHEGYSKRIIAAGFAFAEIANSLLTVSAALRIVGTMNIETMISSAVSLGLFAVVILGVMDNIGQQGTTDGQIKSHEGYSRRILAAATAFAEIAGSLLIVSAALRIVGTMSIEKMWSSMGALTSTAVIILVAIDTLAKQTSGKSEDLAASSATSKRMLAAATAFGEIAGSLIVISAALRIVGSMNGEQMAASVVSLIVMTIAVLAALSILSQQTSGKSEDLAASSASSKRMIAAGAAFGEIAGSLTGIAYALKVVSTIEEGKFLSSVTTMVVMLAAISAVLALFSESNPMFKMNFDFDTKKMNAIGLAFIEMSGSMILIGTALAIIANIDSEALGRSAKVLALSLGAISAALIAVDKFGKDTAGISTILGAGAIMIVATAIRILAPALTEFGQMEWEEIGKALTTIGGALVIFIGAVAGLGAIIGLAMPGAIALGIIGGAIALLGVGVKQGAEGIAALNESTDTLVESVTKLAALNDDGKTEAVDTAFTQLQNAFSGFATAIGNTGFWAEGRAEGIVALVNSTDTLVDAVERLIGLDSDKVDSVLTSLGNAYSGFGTAIKESGLFGGIKGQGLADVAASTDQLSSAIKTLGEMKPDQAAQGIYALKDAITQLGGALAGFDSDTSNVAGHNTFATNSKAKSLTELAEGATKLGDAVAKMAGIDNASEAIDNLKKAFTDLGSVDLSNSYLEMSDLSMAVDTLVGSIIDSDASGAVNGFADALTRLSSYDGTASSLTTTTDELNNSATAAGDLSENVEGLNTTLDETDLGQQKFTDAQTALTEFQNGLKDLDTTSGNMDLSSLQSQLTNLTSSLSNWDSTDSSKYLGGLTTGTETTATPGVTTTAGTTDQSLVDYLQTLSEKVNDFATSIRDSGAEGVVTGLVGSLQDLSLVVDNIDYASFTTAGGIIATSLQTGFTDTWSDETILAAVSALMVSISTTVSDGEDAIQVSFTTIITNVLAELNSDANYDNFHEVGEFYINAMSEGIEDSEERLMDGFDSVLTDAMKELNGTDYYNQFYEIGTYFAQGIADGITAGTDWIVEAAANAAASAKEAAAGALDEHSPSKVGFKIGAYFPEGIANGILSMGKAVANASKHVAGLAVKGAQIPSMNYGGIASGINLGSMPNSGYSGYSNVTNNSNQSKTITIAPVVNITGRYTPTDGARIARDIDKRLGEIL